MRAVIICSLCACLLNVGLAHGQGVTGNQPGRKVVDVVVKRVEDDVRVKVDPGVVSLGSSVISVSAPKPLDVVLSQPAAVNIHSNGYLNGVDIITNIREVHLYFVGEKTPVAFTPQSRASTGVPCIAGDWIFVSKKTEWNETVEVQDWRPLSQINRIEVRRYSPTSGQPGLKSILCGQ